jgi:ribosome-binding factor A
MTTTLKPLRIQKIEKELHKCIGQALSEFLFLDQGVLVTVVQVDVSQDTRSARVFVSVFPDKHFDEILEELNVVRGDIQHLIAKKIRMKFMPKISWHKDKSVEEIDRIGKIFSEHNSKFKTKKTKNIETNYPEPKVQISDFDDLDADYDGTDSGDGD